MEPKRKRPARRPLIWLRIAVLAALAGTAALTFAWAQSESGWSVSLNSPVAFPVDI